MTIKLNNEEEVIDFYGEFKSKDKWWINLQDSATDFKESVEWVAGWFLSWIPSMVWNTLWFWLDIVGNLPWASKTIWETIRKKWRKDTENMANMLWVDLESTSAQIWWLWTELLWVGKMKLPAKVIDAVKAWKISPKVAWLMNKYWTAFAKKYPKIAASIKTSIDWWKEWAKFWIVSEWDLESVWEYWTIGWVLWWAWWFIWKWFQQAAPIMSTRLQLSWLLNSNKLKSLWKNLAQSWEKLPWQIKTPERATNWMIDRWIKWSEEQMISKLNAHFDKAENLYRTTINSAKWRYSPDVVLDLLKEIKSVTKNKRWLSDVNKELKKFIDNFDDWLTIPQIDRVKRLADDFLQIFKDTWEAKKEAAKVGQWILRRKTKEFIEEIVWKMWWNARMLNNEKAVSKTLIKWIEAKDETASLKSLMWYMWIAWLWGWISAAIAGKDPTSSLWFAVWTWVVWWILSSKRIQTNIASVIRNLSKTEKEKINKFDWVKYLPEDLKNLLNK